MVTEVNFWKIIISVDLFSGVQDLLHFTYIFADVKILIILKVAKYIILTSDMFMVEDADFETCLSGHHKLVWTILKLRSFEGTPKIKMYRSFKKFNMEKLAIAFWRAEKSACTNVFMTKELWKK